MSSPKKTLRKIAGFSLIGLGVAGLVIPILPGLTAIAPGLALLAQDYPWARRYLNRGKRTAVKLRRRRRRMMRRPPRAVVDTTP